MTMDQFCEDRLPLAGNGASANMLTTGNPPWAKLDKGLTEAAQKKWIVGRHERRLEDCIPGG